jgi:hypothetical protein
MKKSLSVLLLLLTSTLLLTAQQSSMDAFVQKYKDQRGFTHAFLSKDLCEVAWDTKIEHKDWQKIHQIVRNIGQLTVLSTENSSAATALFKEALATVPRSEFDEVLSVQHENDRVRLWTQDDKQSVTNLVLLVGSDEAFVLVAFEGIIDLDKVLELAQTFGSASAQDMAKSIQATQVDFNISPNPCSDRFVLALSDPADATTKVLITDQSGRLQRTVTPDDSPRQYIDVSQLPAGTYWVQVQTAKGKSGVRQLQVVD